MVVQVGVAYAGGDFKESVGGGVGEEGMMNGNTTSYRRWFLWRQNWSF